MKCFRLIDWRSVSQGSPSGPGLQQHAFRNTPSRIRHCRILHDTGPSTCGSIPRVLETKERLAMIELHYWTTPNGHKITMFLEEAGLDYKIVPVNIGKGEQFKPEFLAVSPNNRIPAILDRKPNDGGAPIPVFESGAILLYLAEKTGKFLPADTRKRYDTIQCLWWQVGGLGHMSGQTIPFSQYANDKIPYAIDRYRNEVNRLYGVLNKKLAGRDFIAGDYSMADMASYPWIVPYERQGQKIEDFPNLKRWFETIKARPATVRAYELAKTINTQPSVTEESKKILFGQTAAVVR